jgi:cytochrome c-type biogenesis protein CcmH/NrfG
MLQACLPQAERALRRALEVDVAHVSARVNLGTVLLQLGRSAEAAAEFREVLRRDPAHERARAGLSEAERR